MRVNKFAAVRCYSDSKVIYITKSIQIFFTFVLGILLISLTRGDHVERLAIEHNIKQEDLRK